MNDCLLDALGLPLDSPPCGMSCYWPTNIETSTDNTLSAAADKGLTSDKFCTADDQAKSSRQTSFHDCSFDFWTEVVYSHDVHRKLVFQWLNDHGVFESFISDPFHISCVTYFSLPIMWIEQLSRARNTTILRKTCKGIIGLSLQKKQCNSARQASNTCLAHTDTNAGIPGQWEGTVPVPWVSEMKNYAVELRNDLSSSSFWDEMKIMMSSPFRVYAAYTNCLNSMGAPRSTFSCEQIEKPLSRCLSKPFAARAGMLAHSWQTT